ncbi:MAG: PAS domain S-box protein [bacterium]
MVDLKLVRHSLIRGKGLIVALFFGAAAFFLMLGEIHLTIPGTVLVTDPREIFVTIGAALSGPVGGLLIGFLSAIIHPVSEYRVYGIIQHMIAAFLVGWAYKKILYQRFRMPWMLLGWMILVILYYFVGLVVSFSLLSYNNHALYVSLLGHDQPVLQTLYGISGDLIPELILTVVVSTLILFVLPSAYRKPLWGTDLPRKTIEFDSTGLKSRIQKFFEGNYLGVRVAVWFLLLSLLPVLVLGLFVQNEMKETFLTVEALQGREQARIAARLIVQQREKSVQNDIQLFARENFSTFFVVDRQARYIAHSDSTKLGRSAWEDYPSSDITTILYGMDGTIRNPEKGTTFGFSTVPQSDLIVVVRSNPVNLQHLMRSLLWISPTRLLLSLFLVALIGGTVIWFFIVRPIRRLTWAVEELGQENFQVRVDAADMDGEVGILANRFNEMSTNLRIAYRGLEEEIAEKTTASEALHLSKARLSEVLWIAHMGYFEMDFIAGTISLSSEALALLGTTADRQDRTTFPIDTFFAQYTHPVDLEKVRQGLQHVIHDVTLSSSMHEEFEFRAINIIGETVWLNSHYRVVKDEQGKAIAVVGSFQDITARKLAELTSETNRKLFQAVVENNLDAIMLLEKSGQIRYVSPSTELIVGYSPDEQVGMNLLDTIHADDRTKVLSAIEHISRRPDAAFRKEFRTRRKDGYWVWVEAVAKNSLGDPSVNAIVVNYRDISERKRAEATIQSIQRGTALASGDKFFRNLALELSTALHTRFAFVSKINQKEQQKAEVFAFVDNGKFLSNREYELAGTPSQMIIERGFCSMTKDMQRTFPHDQSIQEAGIQSYFGLPLTSSSGQILGIVSVMHDHPLAESEIITSLLRIFAARAGSELERLQAEERINMLALALENVTDCVCITDPENNFIFVNDAFLRVYGYSESEIIGKNILMIYSSSNDSNVRSLLQPSALGGGWKGELCNKRKDGTDFPIYLSVSAIRDNDEKLVAFIGIATDISERKKADVEMVKLRQAVESSSGIVFMTDCDSMITYINPSFTRLYGYSEEEVVGKTTPRILKSGIVDSEEYKNFWQQLSEKQVMRGELINRTKDGRLVTVDSSANPIIDVDGNLVGFLAIQNDISEKKKAEEALLHSEENLRNAQRIGKIGSWEVRLDTGAVEWSEETYRIFGRSPADFHPDQQAIIDAMYPEDRQSLQRLFKHPNEHRDSLHLDHRVILPDGTIKYVHMLMELERDKDEVPTRMIGSIQDITDRKLAEHELIESRNFNAQVMAATPSIVYVFDLIEGKIVYANKSIAELLGYSLEELMAGRGSMWIQVIHPDDKQSAEAVEKQWEIATDEDLFSMEYRVRTKDGDWRWILGREKVLKRTGEGRVHQIIGLATDFTDRRKAEEEIRRLNTELEQRVRDRTVQLESTNKELEAFSYSVSHDLRAPLRHVSGFVDLLRDHTKDTLDAQSTRFINTIAKSAVQMGTLIDDLLAFSRIGRAELRTARIATALIVEDVLKELEHETRDRSILWTVGQLPEVRADHTLIKLVFSNLISNALKFTRKIEEAHIEIGCLTTEEQSQEYIFFVRDNGAGFEMKYVDKLFGVFQRLHTVEEFEGTGIGLANVRRIVHRHGGKSWAEGILDGGATFFFSIPR